MSTENEAPLPEEAIHLPEDATHVETPVPRRSLEKRGASLNRLFVHFDARADESRWRQLIRDMHFNLREHDPQGAGFIALPEKPGKYLPVLAGAVSMSTEEPGTASWSFEWRRAPDDEPPDELRTVSAAVGGFPAILTRLDSLWPTTQAVRAEVSASYVILGSYWQPQLPSLGGRYIPAGNQRLKVSPTQWTVDPPSGPVHEVIRVPTHEPGAMHLLGRGTYDLRWSSQFLNEVDGAIWNGLKALLKPRSPKQRT
jgi:hypothetical protein